MLRAVSRAATLFQSTRPRGARPGRADRGKRPRSVSIHAPARGATARASFIDGDYLRFNPRAREGRDQQRITADRAFHSFNPRAREGRDGNMLTAEKLIALVSIHAPARGATRGD